MKKMCRGVEGVEGRGVDCRARGGWRGVRGLYGIVCVTGGNGGRQRWRWSEVMRVVEGRKSCMEQCKEKFRKGQGLGMGWGGGRGWVEGIRMEVEEPGRGWVEGVG